MIVSGHEVKRRKLSAAGWEVVVDGVVVGRMGGRDGARWGQLADGTMVTEDTRASAAVVLGRVVDEALSKGLVENPVDNLDAPLRDYRIVGVQDNVYQAAPGAPKQPGGSCWHCGTGIMVEVVIQNTKTHETHTIGTTCAERVGLDRVELKAMLAEKFAEERRVASAEYQRQARAEWEARDAAMTEEFGPHGTESRYWREAEDLSFCEVCIAAAPHGTPHRYHFGKCRCLVCLDAAVTEDRDFEYAELSGLVRLSTGELATEARIVDTQYGIKWVVDEADGSTSWIPVNPARRTTQTKHGYVEADVEWFVERCGPRGRKWSKRIVPLSCPLVDIYGEPIVRPTEEVST